MIHLAWIATLVGAPAAYALVDGNPKNGLSSDSFLRNALTTNPDALRVLQSSPLGPALLAHPTIALQLNERGARAVIEEIIKCALAPSATLSYTDAAGTQWRWRGELGLCHEPQAPAGDWSAAPPTRQCQELVTACVMARVNGLDKSIPLSLRDEAARLSPRVAVGVETTLREPRAQEDPTDGTPIESFRGPFCQVGHECQWAAAYVGKCTGGTVAVEIDDPQRCATTPVRICAGIHGCYGPGSPVGYPSEVDYSKFVKQQVGACPSAPLVFPCPVGVGVGGFFGVMLRRPSGDLQGPSLGPPPVKVSSSGAYPASEKQIFSYVEGAFYGNLFESDELAVRCRVEAEHPTVLLCVRTGGAVEAPCGPAATVACAPRRLTVPYRHVYACYGLSRDGGDPEDAAAVAYMNDRVCAQRNGDEPCFPHPPQRCGRVCEWDAVSGIYKRCRGTDRLGGETDEPRTYQAITTYLNDPCDLLSSAGLCARVRRLIFKLGNGEGPASGGAGVPEAPRPRGCGGCASGGGAAAAPLAIALLALLVGGVRRRR